MVSPFDNAAPAATGSLHPSVGARPRALPASLVSACVELPVPRRAGVYLLIRGDEVGQSADVDLRLSSGVVHLTADLDAYQDRLFRALPRHRSTPAAPREYAIVLEREGRAAVLANRARPYSESP